MDDDGLLIYDDCRVTMALGLYYYGLRYTTATYASTFLNLVPIVTFVFSTVLGYATISNA